MSAWEYSDYITIENATERRKRLALHVREVVDALRDFTSRSGADGWSYSRQSLDAYYKTIKAELDTISPPRARPRAGFYGLR